MFATKREAAHAAARLGFDVIPLAPNAKYPPLITDWPNRATQDPKQIDAWFDEWPDANIGGATKDKLVFDIDKRNQGWDTWGFLKITEDFPNTLCATTAGGGAHVIYQLREGQQVKNGAHKAGQGVDIKGDGGYIVMPGSTIDGKPYEWDNNTPMAFAPQWAIDAYKGSKRKKTDSAGKRIVEEDDQARELFEQWMIKHAPMAYDGEIDETTYKMAARGYDFGCSEQTVFDIVSEWDETHCFPQNNSDRLPVVVESAGHNRENAIGSKHPLASPFDAVEDVGIAPAESVKPSLSTENKRFYAVRADEGAKRALDNPGEPLIKGIIHRGTMSVLIGAPGGGKTFLGLDWSYHIAKGLPWAGKAVHQGAVVYLAAEAGNMIMSRLAALQQHYGPLGDAPLYVIPCSADFAHGPEDAKAVLALILDIEKQSGQKVEFFVVDTLNRAMSGGDENSSKDMGAVIQAVDFIREQAKTHTMIIHHPGKDENKGGRGHSSMLGGTDTEMLISNRVLSFTKQRDMPIGPEIKFKVIPVVIGTDREGTPVTSCYVQVSAPGEPEIQEELSGRLRDVLDELDDALEEAHLTVFDMAFLSRINFRHSSANAIARSTLKGWMAELAESGYLRKGARGQWVRLNGGNGGNGGN